MNRSPACTLRESIATPLIGVFPSPSSDEISSSFIKSLSSIRPTPLESAPCYAGSVNSITFMRLIVYAFRTGACLLPALLLHVGKDKSEIDITMYDDR